MTTRVSQKNFILEFANVLDQSCQMVYKYTTKSLKFIDQLTKVRQHFLVLQLQLQWGNQPKMRSGLLTFDWGVLLTRSTCLNCILQDLFRD